MVMGKLLAGSRFFCMVGLPIFRNNCRNPRRKQHFRAPIANRHIPSLDDNPFRSIVGSGRINIRSIYALFRCGSRTEYLARYLCCFRNHHGTCHSQHLYPELNPMKQLTGAVMIGVLVTLIGIAIIGIAGAMRAATLAPETSKANKKGNSFYKGIIIALLCGFMSGCFNVGLTFGQNIHFTATPALFHTLPATFLVTLGGFFTNAVYCLYQNNKNHTWGDYAKGNTWGNNLVFCILAGGLWYSQFFGLSLGKNFLLSSPALLTLSFCILMALNVVFSNIWGIILQEWKGCSKKVIAILILGVIILMISPFIPQLI